MKLHIKTIVVMAALLGAAGCKNKDDRVRESETTTIAADTSYADTVSTEIRSDTVASNTANNQSGPRKFYKPSAKSRLTQYQIDSIKTERGAIVTPAKNMGASLTPGSGMAVPSNTKTGPGTTASMGSSTGN